VVVVDGDVGAGDDVVAVDAIVGIQSPAMCVVAAGAGFEPHEFDEAAAEDAVFEKQVRTRLFG
jgi:hypothetical protein